MGGQCVGKRIATGVDWAFAPEWLTIRQACALSGWTAMEMLAIIEVGGVDLKDDPDDVFIDKQSLRDYQEACALVLHWSD